MPAPPSPPWSKTPSRKSLSHLIVCRPVSGRCFDHDFRCGRLCGSLPHGIRLLSEDIGSQLAVAVIRRAFHCLRVYQAAAAVAIAVMRTNANTPYYSIQWRCSHATSNSRPMAAVIPTRPAVQRARCNSGATHPLRRSGTRQGARAGHRRSVCSSQSLARVSAQARVLRVCWWQRTMPEAQRVFSTRRR